jgi:hypothetical protein
MNDPYDLRLRKCQQTEVHPAKIDKNGERIDVNVINHKLGT